MFVVDFVLSNVRFANGSNKLQRANGSTRSRSEHSKLSSPVLCSLLTTSTGELNFVEPFIVRYANWRTCEPNWQPKVEHWKQIIKGLIYSTPYSLVHMFVVRLVRYVVSTSSNKANQTKFRLGRIIVQPFFTCLFA